MEWEDQAETVSGEARGEKLLTQLALQPASKPWVHGMLDSSAAEPLGSLPATFSAAVDL